MKLSLINAAVPCWALFLEILIWRFYRIFYNVLKFFDLYNFYYFDNNKNCGFTNLRKTFKVCL
jgi:hypothetical protein